MSNITKGLQDFLDEIKLWSIEDANRFFDKLDINIPNCCKDCSNHPSNGGSGVCHCILGNNVIY